MAACTHAEGEPVVRCPRCEERAWRRDAEASWTLRVLGWLMATTLLAVAAGVLVLLAAIVLGRVEALAYVGLAEIGATLTVVGGFAALAVGIRALDRRASAARALAMGTPARVTDPGRARRPLTPRSFGDCAPAGEPVERRRVWRRPNRPSSCS